MNVDWANLLIIYIMSEENNMNTNVYKIIVLVGICLICIFWTACSGDSDETKRTELTLKVDRNTLKADGKEMVTFTVEQAGTDITSDATIRCLTDGKAIAGAVFSTVTSGKYVFEASYNGQVSAQVIVTADKTAVIASKFVRRICAMEMTGTWCAMCPAGLTRLNYLTNLSYGGIVYLMAFHVNGTSSDPMVIAQSSLLSGRFAVAAYPACIVDMRDKMGLSENYSVMRGIFNESLENYPAHCGVAMQSDYDEAASQAIVTVKVTSERTSEYRLILYAVEDGLKYQQNDGGVYRDYTHNHVVRKLLSATVDGDKLGQIAADKEETKDYIIALEEEWNLEKLSFYALVTDENGYVNNLAICKAANGEADYEYVND